MKLSERRKQAIYEAVHRVIMDVRIVVARKYPTHPIALDVDALISRAGDEAGQAAIAAAEADHRGGRS